MNTEQKSEKELAAYAVAAADAYAAACTVAAADADAVAAALLLTNTAEIMNTENVKTNNGLEIAMILVKIYPNGKLFFAQERLCITDLDNKEIDSKDLINFVESIF